MTDGATPLGIAWPVRRRDFLRNFFTDRSLNSLARRVTGKGYPMLAVVPSDAIGQGITARGLYEEEYLRAIFEQVVTSRLDEFRSSVALDIGANIGNHSCFLARYFKEVIAFEPNPPVYKLLEANLALNDISNVKTVPLGLSDQNATLQFFENRSGNLGGSTFSSSVSGRADERKKQLRVVVGDEFLLNRIDGCAIALIKIDVEGHELAALHGLSSTLSRSSALVLFEALAPKSVGGGAEVMSFLNSHGYRHFYALEQRWRVGEGVRKIRKVRGLVQLLLGLLHGADYYLFALTKLENRSYPMIIASKTALNKG